MVAYQVGGRMSIEMMNHAWNIDGLTPTKKLILLLLGSYADENGTCYPSYRHIANKIGLKDTKGVRKAIKEFEDMGFLRIENRYKKDGGLTSNRYYLLIGDSEGVSTLSHEVSEPHNTKDNTKTNKNKEDKNFDVFWSDYPRKVSKKSAKTSWFKALKNGADPIRICVACIQFAKFHKEKGTELDYIPHPSTWLNQERWEDSLEILKNDNNKSLNNLAG